MKKAFTDVKSFVTILFALALVILLFIAVFKSERVFETVFLLFTNLCTAVFTYFFTKKNTDSIVNDNIEKYGGIIMIKGLDISSYQKGINLDVVANAGYKFLILRAGFTGWGTGESYNKDNQFETFYSQAKAKGIPVGAYWYSCADNYQKGEIGRAHV